jgi:PKD repeat protein
MNPPARFLLTIGAALTMGLLQPTTLPAAPAQVLGWNNLGMHCMDSDYSVFSILPPYNTIEAQLIVSGKLVTNGSGYSVTYQAVADPDGSINKTSAGKGNWLQFAPLLYGGVASDQGLPFPGPDSFWMPGANNTPQGMLFDADLDWFYAYGVPITPYDDAGHKNPYPLMRVIARNTGGTAIATNDIVLPVSDEMDCRTCHASGTQLDAQSAAGWVWSDNPERDFRLNILRLHDEGNFAHHRDVYVSALAARGFNPQGLYRGVVADGKPVLCAVCHASEALGTGSYSNIPPLTASLHSKHAPVMDPELNLTLDHSDNRSACYRCHPGSATKCLRGAMGGAIANDGSMSMQCQSCHGNMSHVGRAGRKGWLEEPNCQSCHTGTATSNNGQIRYASSFTDTNNWIERLAVNQTFATKSNTPAAGVSLYRFSAGHGGLQCSACHGSTHAEFPATHRNDNVRNEKIQGHAGVMIECTSCHTSMSVSSTTARGGPHGMHPVGSSWAKEHHDFIGNLADCRACHGTDYRGTPLSRMQTARTISVSLDGTPVSFPTFKGAEVGCYNCHNGPFESSPTPTTNPVASNITTNTLNSATLTFALPISGAGAVARIMAQPAHGSVGVSNNVATYFPEAGYVGTDTFTYAAYNGSKNSTLATGSVVVAQGPFSLVAKALVPTSYPANWAVPFTVVATPVNVNATPTYAWDFGDGSPTSTNQYPTHSYATPGTYHWSMSVSVQSGVTTATTNLSGTTVIGDPVSMVASQTGNHIQLSWPLTTADALVEESPTLGPDADWTVAPYAFVRGGGMVSISVPNVATRFFRLRKL